MFYSLIHFYDQENSVPKTVRVYGRKIWLMVNGTWTFPIRRVKSKEIRISDCTFHKVTTVKYNKALTQPT